LPGWSGLLAAASLLLLAACGKQETPNEFVVFDREQGCFIGVPDKPSEGEMRAAKLIQETLAKASGKRAEDFPIRHHERWSLRSAQADTGKPARSAGSTLYIQGPNHRKIGEGRLDEKVTLRVQAGRAEISSYPAEAIEAAAAWFLENKLGARWFMPGPLGEHVPRQESLRLPLGEESHAPSYISRNLGVGGGEAEKAWWSRNRLRVWFQHTHAMNPLFTPEDLRQNPEFASLVNGRKNVPPDAKESNWQPNIAADGAAEHAAAVLAKRREFSSPIGMNDSIRYDQSARTREQIGEPRWFRLKPDFSKLVFRFVNDVAKRLPGRYLGAYAYDWTEDTPGFPIERNVVPYLTADRSEWFDPAFAAEDQALIKRWVAAGPEVVGLYDYYYGAPFLVPRPTLYAVSRAIPFAHESGVRAFYAEVYPNWGLDGPKAWLAAQLLWDARAKPEDLLDIYYRDFWREAAGPMREYFVRCDEQWLNQPKPSYWIKYYKDEHQHLLFPVGVRRELQALLAAAQAAAKTDLTRRRVDFFARAFAVTDAFCAWGEAKEALSRAALTAEPEAAAVRQAWDQFEEKGRHLKQLHARLRQEEPRAIKADLLGDYERNDPRLRAAWRLREAKAESVPWLAAANPVSVPAVAGQRDLKAEGQESNTSSASSSQGLALTSAFSFQLSGFPLRLSGTELLKDAGLAQVQIKSPTGFFDLEWVEAGAWRGHGEPYETRRVSVEKAAGGKLKAESVPLLAAPNPVSVPAVAGQRELRQEEKPETGNLRPEMSNPNPQVSGLSSQVSASPSGFRSQVSGFSSLLMRGCKQETFSQVVPGEAGQWYVARVKVRAKVSPGNMTFLILNFQDEAGRTMGMGVVDRLPVGDYVEGVELVTWMQAPTNAKWVGMGVRALNQVSDDFAEFSAFSLQAMR